MGRNSNLRIKALEERRKRNSTIINTNSGNRQKKKVMEEDLNKNQSHHPTSRIFDFDFRHDFYEDYDDFCNPFDYDTESYSDFCNLFDSTGYSGSDSFFDEEDEANLQGFADVDIEALEGDETSGVMLRLPSDIFLDILSRLPIRSLARCRCVCKTWRKIVHHPRFTSMHHIKAIQLHNSYDHKNSSTTLVLHSRYSKHELQSDIYMLEYDFNENPNQVMTVKPRFWPSDLEFEAVGSCNGLLCLSEPFYYDPIYVCNPVIGEYVKLPESYKRTNFDIVSGFGYDHVSNEYKVIRMLFDSIEFVSEGHASFKLEAEVYTLGSGVWRKLGDVPYPLRGKSSSVFVNGALHWMTDDYIGLSVSEHIISFDVSREEFGVVPPPRGFDFGSDMFQISLGDLRSCLCLFDYSSNDQFEIWVMKDYAVKESWTKEFVISRREMGFDKFFFRPLKVLDNGEMLLVHNNEFLVCYDLKQRSVRTLRTHELPSIFEVFTHVGSFVSLKDIIGPTTSRRSVNSRKWYRTMYPLPSHNPELDIEDWTLDYEAEQLAALMDSGVALSDLYQDW